MNLKPYAGSDLEAYRSLGKKDQEHATVSGLLLRLGFSGFQITPNERPDALVDFSDAKGTVRLGCEIQALQSDDGPSGSELREFHSRWIRVMERVIATLRGDGVAVPYCNVLFRDLTYSALRHVPDHQMISEFVRAGRRLRVTSTLVFPQSDLPTLSSILSKIQVVNSDGLGLLWWPAHLQSGEVPALDGAVVEAVCAKGKLAATFDWKDADEKLLLLVAEARGLTDVMGYAREIKLPTHPTLPFTWVLIWDRFSEDIWAIFPNYAIICNGHEQRRWPQLLPLKLRKYSTQGRRYPTRPKAR